MYLPVEQILAETLTATNHPPERAREVRKAMCVHVGSRIVPHERRDPAAGGAFVRRGCRRRS